jgi:divalent metal cation (Fe/Co/Zn/Cd) transporter
MDLSVETWRRRALFLAWFTVGYNLVEGGVSIFFGVKDESVSLWGFGLDSLVEVTSAFVVLWRLKGATSKERERRAVLAIASLFLILALSIVVGASLQLLHREHPATTLPGILVALLSLSFMGWLWRAKVRVAQALDSASLAGDAACSLACLQLSAVLLAGSALHAWHPALWWVDAVAAIGLAILIAREGAEAWRAARKPDFQGGCGCH